MTLPQRRRRVGRPGLIGTMARTAVLAGTAPAVSGDSRRRATARDAAAADRQQAALQSQSELAALRRDADARRPPGRPPSGSRLVAELETLAGLRASDALSAEEFRAAKAKLLG